MNYARREKMKELFKTSDIITLKDLAAIFPEVSTMPIRRDLEYFEHEGLIMIIRGGCKVLNHERAPAEENYADRAVSNVVYKMQVAKAALPYLETGRSVFIDSGSTMMCFAKMVPNIKLSVITNAPNIALEIAGRPLTTVSIVGGSINHDNLAVSGAQSLAFLRSVNIDIAFIAASGLSAGGGFTCGNYAECEVKRAIIKKANKKIVLMDSTKVGKSLAYTFANLKDIDILITNERLPENLYVAALKGGAEVKFFEY